MSILRPPDDEKLKNHKETLWIKTRIKRHYVKRERGGGGERRREKGEEREGESQKNTKMPNMSLGRPS